MLFRIFYLLGIFCLIFSTVRLPFADIGISDVFIFAALGIWVIQYLAHRGQDGWGIPMHFLWLPAVLILVGGLLSSFNAVRPTTSVAITVKTVYVVSIWITLALLVVRRGDLHLAVSVFLLAVFTASAIALIDRWTGTRIGDAFSGNDLLFYNRSASTLGHPNELGYITSVGLPIALGMLLAELVNMRRGWVVVSLGVTCAVSGLALFYSGSVTAWVSVVLSISVFGVIALLRATMLQRFAVVCGILVLAGAGIWFFSEPTRQAELDFLLDFNLGRATTLTGPGRTQLLEDALAIIEQNPYVGAGMDQTGTGKLGSAERVTDDLIHNTLMSGWLSGGLLVFVGLAICYLVALLTGLRALRRGYWQQDWLMVGLGACILGWIVFDQTQPNLYHRFTWLTLAWLFGLGLQIRWSDDSNVPPVAAPSEARPETWRIPPSLDPHPFTRD